MHIACSHQMTERNSATRVILEHRDKKTKMGIPQLIALKPRTSSSQERSFRTSAGHYPRIFRPAARARQHDYRTWRGSGPHDWRDRVPRAPGRCVALLLSPGSLTVRDQQFSCLCRAGSSHTRRDSLGRVTSTALLTCHSRPKSSHHPGARSAKHRHLRLGGVF